MLCGGDQEIVAVVVARRRPPRPPSPPEPSPPPPPHPSSNPHLPPHPAAVRALLLPPQVTLAGHVGKGAKYMGQFKLCAERANGYPCYSKRVAGGGAHWLYRSSGGGEWMVTDAETSIAKNAGGIGTSTAAELPTEAGLVWQYADEGFHDDPEMTCTGGMTALIFAAHEGHAACLKLLLDAGGDVKATDEVL